MTSYVNGLCLPSAITASILLLTMTVVHRTAHRRDEEMSIS
ncbi:hypothetical protein [Paractinoplanes hotanensis]|nr:hypothetical protein [Actinoplanes hotanensis]